MKVQIIDILEMNVFCDKRESVLLRDRRNPDIIFGNWLALFSQAVLDLTIYLSSVSAARKDCIVKSEFAYAGMIFLDPR